MKPSSISASKPSTTSASKPSSTSTSKPSCSLNSAIKKDTKLTPLQKKMQQKLLGGKFRWINEQLYKNPSRDSLNLFKNDKSLFFTYHEGFKSQVKSWPCNPVDIFISYLKKLKEKKVVADLGCGEAKIAETCTNHLVHSFDLVAANEKVIVADIANVPLASESVDVVIFCLSLMGSNYIDFIKEANRILKVGGELKIAEVSSRLESVGKFIDSLLECGFTLVEKDESNNYFIILAFEKSCLISKKTPPEKDKSALKPCLYKKR